MELRLKKRHGRPGESSERAGGRWGFRLNGFLKAMSGHTEPGLYLLVWCSSYCLEWGVRSEQGAEGIPVGTRLVQGARAQMTKDMNAGESAPEWGGRAHTGGGEHLFWGGVGSLNWRKLVD